MNIGRALDTTVHSTGCHGNNNSKSQTILVITFSTQPIRPTAAVSHPMLPLFRQGVAQWSMGGLRSTSQTTMYP